MSKPSDVSRVICLVFAFAAAWTPGYLSPHQVTAYLTVHHFSIAEAGVLSMAEIGALALVSIVAAWVPDPVIGRYAVWFAILAGAGEWFSRWGHGFTVMLTARTLVGTGCAVCGLAATRELAKSSSGSMLFSLSTAGLSMLASLLLVGVPRLPGDAAARIFLPLAAVCLACSIALFMARSGTLDSGLSAVVESTSTPGSTVTAMLSSAIFVFLPIGGLWTFSAYQGSALGLSDDQIGIILGWTTLSGLLGSALAAWIDRTAWGKIAVFLAFLFASATCVAVGTAGSSATFAAAFCFYNVAYMYAMSQLLGLAASLDDSGRVAALFMGLQLLAVALGNGLFAYLIQNNRAGAAWQFGAMICLAGLLPIGHVIRRARHSIKQGME